MFGQLADSNLNGISGALNCSSWTISGWATTGNTTTINCYPYWQMNTPLYYSYSYPLYFREDKGEKAFAVVKALQKSGAIQLKTAKQFMDVMDAVLQVL